MTEPPREAPPAEDPDEQPRDRTRAMKLPPVPMRPPTGSQPAVPGSAGQPSAPPPPTPAAPVPGVAAEQPTDELPPGPPAERHPTLRFGPAGGAAGATPEAAPPGFGTPEAAPPGYGVPPGHGPQAYGSPGYGPPGYSGPAAPAGAPYGPPGYGAPAGPAPGGPAYGAPPPAGPGYGPPGYGLPPAPPRRPLWPWLVALGVLVVGVGVLLFFLLRSDPSDGGNTAAPSTTAASSAPTTTSAAPSSSSAEPSTTGASGDELNDPSSPQFAAAWVQLLVDGDAETAYQQLCADGMNEVSNPDELQSNFEGYLGGRIQSGSVTDAVGAQGDDYVTISATLDTGADKEFTVVVVQEAGGPAVCGIVDPSEIP